MNKKLNSFIEIKEKTRPKIRYWLPEAMVDLDDLKQDLIDFKGRGFGGVEIVPFKTPIKQDKNDDWGSEYWYSVLETIIKTAKELSLKVDIANGPQWPIAMPDIKNADQDGTLYELTYGLKVIKNFKDDDKTIPQPRLSHDEGTPILIALMAYQQIDDYVIDDHTYINLLPYYNQHTIDYDFKNCQGTWVIFAFWQQPACQKINNQYYVIDHLSLKGVEHCRNYWFKNIEPIVNQYPNVCESIFCDSIEYKVSLDWTRDFISIFKNYKGYDISKYLPVIGQELTYPRNDITHYRFNDRALTECVNNDYFDTLSYCFNNHHLLPLEEMAKQMQLNIRYQVAYNKPFQIESAAACVSICENETLKRNSINNLKTMAGAVHLYHKPIYSYECHAEFENAYGQTYEDLLWWIKRGALAGINNQVLHGASYNGGYHQSCLPNVTWPGYEAFGRFISNYWNRQLNPQVTRQNIEAIAKINTIMQKQPHIDLAIYRQTYLNNGKGGDGDYIIHDHQCLMNHGYTYDFVSLELLLNPSIQVTHHRLDENGVGYKALILPETTHLSLQAIEHFKTLANSKFPIFLVNVNQISPMYKNDYEQLNKLKQEFENLLSLDDVYQVDNYEKLIELLKQHQIFPDTFYTQEVEIGSLHLSEEMIDYYYFYNYSKIDYRDDFVSETYFPTLNKDKFWQKKHLNVNLLNTGKILMYDYISDSFYDVNARPIGAYLNVDLDLFCDQAIILMVINPKLYDTLDIPLLKQNVNQLQLKQYLPLDDWTLNIYQFLPKSKESYLYRDSKYQFIKQYQLSQTLKWWHELDDQLEKIAGVGVYQTQFNIHQLKRYFINIPHINNGLQIKVNGKNVPCISQSMQIIELTDYLQLKENKLEIIIDSSLANYLVTNAHQSYGIEGVIYLYID